MKPEKSTAERPEATMSVMEAIYKRHATRYYTSQRLEKKTIQFLLDAAVHAPTAMHEEPWAFAIIQDEVILKRISDSVKKMLDNSIGKGHAFEKFLSPNSSVFYDAGTLIVIYGKPVGPFVVADCWLAAENLMLAACTMGLGTCVIGLSVSVLNSPELKKELGIPSDMTAFAPIIVGIPKGEAPAVPRKDPEIIFWK